jgi:hypothetical protein
MIEDENDRVETLYARVPDERDGARGERRQDVAPVADPGRRNRPDQHVTRQASRRGGDEREHADAEYVEPRLDAGGGTAHREDERAQQVQR